MTAPRGIGAHQERIPMSTTLLRSAVLALALLALVSCGPAATPARAQVEEEPAAEAPPVKPRKPAAAPAAAAEEEEETPVALPATPKAKAPKADAALPTGPLANRVEKQGKELAALKKENDELKKQVRLLYLIVNKLAGLNQAQ